MKRLFLASSFADVAKYVPAFLEEACEGKTVTFIPTASLVESVDFYVGSAKKAFKKLGILVDELDISKATQETITETLKKNDYIYISGGNTFYILQELKRTGADSIIVELIRNGKPYIGESAGSILMAPNIEYVKKMDDCSKASSLSDYSSLGVISFYPVPHHTNFPFKKAVEKIITEYGSRLDLWPMTNKQALTILGEQVTVIG